MNKEYIYKKKKPYGSVKQAVISGCEKGLTAKEISEIYGITKYTVYSIARRVKMRPRLVRSDYVHLNYCI